MADFFPRTHCEALRKCNRCCRKAANASPDGMLGHALADISVREFRRRVCFRSGARSQSEDLVFVLFSDEEELLLLSEDGPLLSDEPDAAALEEPLVVPLLGVSLLGLLSDFSLDPSVALALPERA
jgi:hypothetical protein